MTRKPRTPANDNDRDRKAPVFVQLTALTSIKGGARLGQTFRSKAKANDAFRRKSGPQRGKRLKNFDFKNRVPQVIEEDNIPDGIEQVTKIVNGLKARWPDELSFTDNQIRRSVSPVVTRYRKRT